jgi:tryptophan 2,3-dioxygenase
LEWANGTPVTAFERLTMSSDSRSSVPPSSVAPESTLGLAGQPREDGPLTDLHGQLDYKTYLALDQVLSAARPLSEPPHHDELLFIVQHQTSELWFKLIIHELTGAMVSLRRGEASRATRILSRVLEVQRLLTEQWSVLGTLSPRAYAQFRYVFGPASGVQSAQNRVIEFMLGNKDARMLAIFRHDEPAYARVKAAFTGPSLYDEFLRYLGRRGLSIPKEVLERDVTITHTAHPDVTAALVGLYTYPDPHKDAYDLAEKLVELDEGRSVWRFRHLKTVSRMNGAKPGTGGTSGASYLEKLVPRVHFPELWDVRTELEEVRPPDSGRPLHKFWPR